MSAGHLSNEPKMSAESAAAESNDVLPSKSTRELDDKTWERLLKRIRDDKCTPVIGSGACTAPPTGADPGEWAKLKYPSKEQIAFQFAADYAYPLDDQTKLERVAKYVAVTDDDYFEFLINISRDYKSLAHRVDRALGGALLFLGYTLSDWDFLVLFRLFANKLRDSGNTHIAVQLEPSDTPGDQAEKAAKAVKYLDSYFGSAQVKIYWGTCQEFCEELRVRWEAFSRG